MSIILAFPVAPIVLTLLAFDCGARAEDENVVREVGENRSVTVNVAALTSVNWILVFIATASRGLLKSSLSFTPGFSRVAALPITNETVLTVSQTDSC